MSLRVLLVHNRYRSSTPSGENRSVEEEVQQLRDIGVEVLTYFVESDEIEGFSWPEKATLAVRPTSSRRDVAAIEKLLRQQPVDVVHVENVYPLLSPAVMSAAQRRGIPVVHSVRSYRHWCMAATFFRDGHVCVDCPAAGSPIPGVVHGCYHGSRVQSVPMAMSQVVHRSTVRRLDRYLPVSEFVARHLRSQGIPESRITVKPNSVVDPGSPRPLGRDVVFVGRLGPEKGLSVLLEAWRRTSASSRQLTIAGDGAERGLAEQAAASRSDVRYLGQLSGEGVDRLIDTAACVVVPSLWHEPFGRVVIEAFARGRPVVAAARGGLTELVDESVGWCVEPSANGLNAALASLDQPTCAVRGAAARHRYQERYTPEKVVRMLVDAYEDAMRDSLNRRTPSLT